jgi:hypothetical protein
LIEGKAISSRSQKNKPMEETIAKPASTRSAIRIRQNSKLTVDGQDLLGYPFTEDAQVYDISSTGISFYIWNRPWIEDSLDITLYPAESSSMSYGAGRKRRGRVVRTGIVHDDKQFVAARFD